MSSDELGRAGGVKGAPLSPAWPRTMGCRMAMTLSRRCLMSAFSATAASLSRRTSCRSRYGCWFSSSRMRWFRRSMCVLLRSRMARWASRSLARFRASCSVVRLATPRALWVRRFLPWSLAAGECDSVVPDAMSPFESCVRAHSLADSALTEKRRLGTWPRRFHAWHAAPSSLPQKSAKPLRHA